MTAPRPLVVFLLVVLIVLVGIYVLGLGRGLQGTEAPTMAELKERFGEARPLRLDELTLQPPAACVRPPGKAELAIPAGATCRLAVGEAHAWQRRALVMRWSPSLDVKVTPAEAREGGLRSRLEAQLGKQANVKVHGKTNDVKKRTEPVRFSIPSAGATIAITCEAATACMPSFVQE